MVGNLRPGRSLLSIVNSIGEALYLSNEPAQTLNLVLDTLVTVLPIDCCWLHLRDKHSHDLNLVGHRGFTAEMVAELSSIKQGESPGGRVALTGQPVVIPDLAIVASFNSAVKAGQHSAALVPMNSGGQLQGILGVSASTIGQFNKETVELLGVLGNHIIIALDKANLFQQTKTSENQLRESEAKFRTLFEEAKDAILLADAATGYIVDANREAERLLARPRREITGMHQSQLHPQDKVDYYQSVFRHQVETRSATEFEAEVVRKDGTRVPVYASFDVIQLADRKLVQGTFKDVSEHRWAERERTVKDSAIASSINAIAFAGRQGNMTYVNRAFLKMWGYDDELDVLGKPAAKFWQTAEQARQIQKALSTSGSYVGELVAIKKDGTAFDVQLSASLVKDESGKIICMMGSFLDITQRKLNEAKIVEQSQRLSVINELAKLISSDSNISEVFESFAQQLRRLFDFDRLSISLIEGNQARFFAVSIVLKTETDIETTIPLNYSATGWVAKYKKTLIQPDLTRERLFPMDNIELRNGLKSSIHVPLFSKGQVFGSLDLSSRRPGAYREKEQEIMEQLAAQISGAIQNASLYSQERASRIELEKQKREWLNFTGIAAHELKTPLTSIIAGAELLGEELKSKAPEFQQRLVQNIVHSAHSLDTSLGELLDLTKMRSLMQVQLAPINIKQLTEVVLEYIRPIVKRKEQVLNINLPDVLPPVNADAQRLEQVLRNLLMNAVKFTPPRGNITLKARQQNKNLVVEVQDSGIGIARDKQTGLFERYYRAEPDREQFPGVGLGLALAKQIVELHGGKIWVDSEPGKGSTFAFSLPL